MLFSHPAMLWGLLAVLIPIVIHLFNFRRYRKVYFSNVEALSELHTESRRRSNVRRWLVLLCRVLAVALLVLAFAGPFIPGRQAEVRSGSTVVSVYIDNSYSMEAASPDGTQLATACDKARQIAAAYSGADRYQLLTADMTGHEMRWLSRDEFLAALDEVQPSPAVRLASEVAARQLSFMAQSGAANRHAYIIGDFQRSTSDLAALPDDSTVRFTLVPLAAAAADNLYVDTLRLDAPAFFAGGSVAVEVTVANSGTRDAEKVPVRLYVDGRERAIATLDIPSASSAKAVLPFTVESDGWHEGNVKIEDYPVTFDDNYYFAINAGGRIGVLEAGPVDGSPLQRLFAADTTVAYRHSDRLSLSEAGEADFIVLDGLRQLPSGDADWLAQWVDEGGSLLVVPAEGAVPDELNAMLARLHAPTLERWVARRSTATAIDYGSSLFQGVFSARTDEMELPAVQGHYMLGSQALRQSVITLADGTDLLTLTPAGEGRVYLLSTPLHMTDFPQQALFVPTFYNMALYSRPLSVPCHTIGSGAPITLQDDHLADDRRPPELTGPDGFSLIPDLRTSGGRRMMVLQGELRMAGIYAIDGERLAFNYGRRESQLDFLDAAEVARAIDGRAAYSMLQSTERPLDQVLRDRDGSHRLWRWCLLLALLALAAETALLKTKAKT